MTDAFEHFVNFDTEYGTCSCRRCQQAHAQPIAPEEPPYGMTSLEIDAKMLNRWGRCGRCGKDVAMNDPNHACTAPRDAFKQLRECLWSYGRHHRVCQRLVNTQAICDCGLDAARAWAQETATSLGVA